MTARRRIPSLLVVLGTAAALAAAAPPARAGGLPATYFHAGQAGVLHRDGATRFTALPLATRTVLTKSRTDGGHVLGASILEGRWGVPIVAEDRASGGLTADGDTLVLSRLARAYPRRRSVFAIVDTTKLAVEDTVELQGDWTLHAVSPNGRWLYVTGDNVRVYDLARKRLLPGPGEPLRDIPRTRATGRGGRWEYTLYLGADRSFVLALDTVERTTRSLDLPRRVTRHRRPFALRLQVRRGRVAVVDGDRTVASVARRTRRASVGGGPPWLLAAAAAVAGGLLMAGHLGRGPAQALSRRSRELR